MKLGSIAVFIVSLLIAYVGLESISLYITRINERNDYKQNQIILEDIKYRFNQFIDLQTSIGTIGSDYFSKGDLLKTEYGPLSNKKLFQINKEIIGFNILNDQGVIVKVFPYETNKKALGNKTQNITELYRSFHLGEPIWFSPPFKLFQGDQGFAIYFPITNGSQLKGWFTTVITTQLFRSDFDLKEFLKTYELSIIDNQTQRPYYSTAILSEGIQRSYNTYGKFHGREITFISWRKDQNPLFLFPTSLKIGGSLLFALLMVIFFKIYDQRKKAGLQLKDISMLLTMTSKEAFAKLIDLQQEIFKVGNPENVKYVTNLLEQVDLLQSTANERKEIGQEEISILPTLLAALEDAQYLINKKNIYLRFYPEKIENLEIVTNPWLFKNNVMESIITYAIIHAQQGSALSIECHKHFSRHILTFHAERTYELDGENNQLINLDRRIEVARRVLNLSNATLGIDRDHAGGMLIRLEFP